MAGLNAGRFTAVHQRNDARLQAAWDLFIGQWRVIAWRRALSSAEVEAIRRGGSDNLVVWALKALVVTSLAVIVSWLVGMLMLPLGVAERGLKVLLVSALTLAVQGVLLGVRAYLAQIVPRRRGAQLVAAMTDRCADPAVLTGIEIVRGKSVQSGLFILSTSSDVPLCVWHQDFVAEQLKASWGWTIGEVGAGKRFAVMFPDGTVILPDAAEPYEPIDSYRDRNAERLHAAEQLWQVPPPGAWERPLTPVEAKVIGYGGTAQSPWRIMWVAALLFGLHLLLTVLLSWSYYSVTHTTQVAVLMGGFGALSLAFAVLIVASASSQGKRIIASLGHQRTARAAVVAIQETHDHHALTTTRRAVVFSPQVPGVPLYLNAKNDLLRSRSLHGATWAWTVGEVRPGGSFAMVFEDGEIILAEKARAAL